MSEEKDEVKTHQFLNFAVTESANGKEYRGKQEIATSYFKERGFGKETVDKLFSTIHDFQIEAAEFCAERVKENKTDARITLPVKNGVAITAGVNMRRFYPDGIPKVDEKTGEKIKPGKKAHYGGVTLGMTFSVTDKMADRVNAISTSVEEACKAHCEKMDAEKTD